MKANTLAILSENVTQNPVYLIWRSDWMCSNSCSKGLLPQVLTPLIYLNYLVRITKLNYWLWSIWMWIVY